MRTGHKGDLSEVLAIAALLKVGAEIALPYGNRPGYDLIVKGCDGSWWTVQVKTAYQRSARGERVYVDFLRGSGKGKRRKYEIGDFDALLAVLPSTGEIWYLSAGEVIGKRCMTVSRDHDGFNFFGWAKT